MAEPVSDPGVVGGALAAACRDLDVLARIAAPLGEAARAAAALVPDRVTRARWAAIARAPVPAGLRGVHPSWIEAGLVGLPERARAAVASGGGDEVCVWLARWATASIPPMPAVTAARVTSVDSATRVDAVTLEGWLADTGADQLALALGAAGAGALARAVRVVGERLARAAERIAVAPRAGALGPVRAAIARCRIALDDRALVRIGARAIAPHVDPLARRQIVHRLPRPIGLVVGDELVAAVHLPVAHAPRWAALAADGTP
ncbi:MAG TPA: hypothetical protein VHN14_32500 [Kofleriaceae bacterium]|nr:hypothetical protein [Kofleriaceae bacterium]